MNNSAPDLFEACEPRNDVLDGKLTEEQFAASIGAVAHDPRETPAIYSDAREFFRKTYPTSGLEELLQNIAEGILEYKQEIEGPGHSKILGLDTTFGGGKTHDLIAAYHLVNSLGKIDELGEFIDTEMAEQLQKTNEDMNVAVIDGEGISGTEARSTDKAEHPRTQTIWGEIAYQLFGLEGYREMEEYDNNRNVPGKKEIKKLFQESGTYNLILLDELALYLEDAASIPIGDSTLAKQTTAYIQRLLGAISQVDNASIIYSVAEQAYSDKAEDVRDAVQEVIQEMGDIFKRKHKIITPTDEDEVGEVLKKRLFKKVEQGAAENFADTYYQYYRNFPRTLPSEAEKPGYREKLEREYPFHPELLSTLTKKVDSIPKFQKTRGALKLIASAVNHLWDNKPESYTRHVIRVHDLTPAKKPIKREIRELSEFFEKLPVVVQSDVFNEDGDSFGQQEDRRWRGKNIPGLGSHITITILWNSIAIGKHATGVTDSELYLNVGHPQLQMDHYDTAKDNLTFKNDIEFACHYLYDEDRIKFKGVPNIALVIQQRKENITTAQAESEIKRNIENSIGMGPFNISKFPQHVADMPDNPDESTLCIIEFEVAEVAEDPDIPPESIKEFYEKTAVRYDGNINKRSYKNNILFLAPDKNEIENAIDKARLFLSQKEVREDDDTIDNFTEEQVDMLDEKIGKSKNLIKEKTKAAYRHLYFSGDDGGLENVVTSSVASNGRGNFQSAVLQTLEDIDRVVKADDEGKAGLWVREKLWKKTKNKMSTRELETQFARKPGLPILLSAKPLRRTVVKIVEEAGFAYWDSVEDKLYWDKDSEEPDNWRKNWEIYESPDVNTEIEMSDVKIRDDCIVYRGIDSFIKEKGDQLEEPESPPTEETECPKCGRTYDSDLDECPYCSNGDGREETWSTSKGPGIANVVLNNARKYPINKGAHALTDLQIKVTGEKKFTHLEHLIKRTSLKKEEVEIGVVVETSGVGESKSAIRVELEGKADTLDSIGASTLQRIIDKHEEEHSVATVETEFDPALAIEEGEDDLLSDLADELEGTDLNLSVRAEGKKSVSEKGEME